MIPLTLFVFSLPQQQALAAIVARIIPASETFNQPGADDPDILHDILTSGAPLRDRLASALANVPVNKPLTPTQVASFRETFPTEAELIQTLTAQCYYRDARVMRALNIEVRAPFPKGYIQEPNDLSLLEPVRQRGEIYRKLP